MGTGAYITYVDMKHTTYPLREKALQLPYGANVLQYKILTNGIINDYDEENFDRSFCLPVKCAIILLLLHALVAVIATLHHVYIAHALEHASVLCTEKTC